MGRVNIGEKVHIWSASVAVYWLLNGWPPLFELNVNALFGRILTWRFEIHEFSSDSAGDFIRRMIKAVPTERLLFKQMRHHPWFYVGLKFSLSMHSVATPVDKFFLKRPSISEIIMTITLYQNHPPSYLAYAHDLEAAPQTRHVQEWTLKCLYNNNMYRNALAWRTSRVQQKLHTGRAWNFR